MVCLQEEATKARAISPNNNFFILPILKNILLRYRYHRINTNKPDIKFGRKYFRNEGRQLISH
jgi:hypothetical protein